MDYLIVDRIENDIAVCQKMNGQMINVPISSIKSDIKEGQCITLDNDAKYIFNTEITEHRKKIIEEKMKKIFD